MNSALKWHLRTRLNWLHTAWIRSQPSIFVIESTNRCNLACRMCPMHGEGNPKFARRERGDMDVDKHRQLIDQIAQTVHVGTIILHGAGEPLLHPAFPELLANVRRHPQLRIAFLTNAVRLDAEMADRLIDLNVDEIGFSLNGADRGTYNALTRTDHWNLVTENIQAYLTRLSEYSHKNGSFRTQTRTQMQIVETPLTQHLIEGFVRDWIGRVDEVVVQTERDASGRALGGASARAVLNTTHHHHLPLLPCHRLAEPLTIAWNGNVHLCCEVWHGEHLLGNVFDEGLEVILRKQQEILKLHRTLRSGSIDVCRGCVAREEVRISTRKIGGVIEMTSPLWRRFRRCGL